MFMPAKEAAATRSRVARLAASGVLVLAAVAGATTHSVPPGEPAAPADAPSSSPAATIPSGTASADRASTGTGSEDAASTAGAAASTTRASGTAAPDAQPSYRTSGKASTAGSSGHAPLLALPAGPAPTTVPYAIGTRLYFAGRVTDLGDRFDMARRGMAGQSPRRQFAAVTGMAGVAWTQFTTAGPDVVHVVGKVSATGAYTPLSYSTGRPSRLAVTSRGVVAMPENGQVFAAEGAFRWAFTGSANIDCGFCSVTAAGPRLVVDQWTGPAERPEHQGTWLWMPPRAIQRIDDRFQAVGRLGSGWLGLRETDGPGESCWRLAPATAPDALGAPVCSRTTPLVDALGRYAVLVSDGRLHVVDPRTGTTVSTGSMPPVEGWSPGTRYAVPAAWESADTYLVAVRLDDELALVRCSAPTGACQRAVSAAVRPGVERIVTERGPMDAVT